MSNPLEPFDASGADAPSFRVPPEMPLLPLRDTVLFPQAFMPLAVARESSVKLIDEAVASGQTIAVFAQKEAGEDEPSQADLHPIGTASQIHKMFKLPDGSLRIIVQGLARVRLEEVTATRPYLRGRVIEAPEILKEEDRLEIDALQRNIKANFQQIVSLSPLMSDDLQALASNITDPGRLADFIASGLGTIATETKQEVLQTLDVRARLDLLNRLLIKELEVLELGQLLGGKLGELLVAQKRLSPEQVAKALARRLGVEYADLAAPPDPVIAARLDDATARRYLALPIRRDPDGVIVVAMADPQDLPAIDDLQLLLGEAVRPVLAMPEVPYDMPAGISLASRR